MVYASLLGHSLCSTHSLELMGVQWICSTTLWWKMILDMYKKRIRRTATVHVVPGSIPDGENCKSYNADGRNEPHCKMQHYSWLMAQCWIQYKANEESEALNFIWFVKLKQSINHLVESFWSWMNRLSYFSSKYGQIHRFQLLICQYKLVLSVCYHSKMNSFAFWTVGVTKQGMKLSP